MPFTVFWSIPAGSGCRLGNAIMCLTNNRTLTQDQTCCHRTQAAFFQTTCISLFPPKMKTTYSSGHILPAPTSRPLSTTFLINISLDMEDGTNLFAVPENEVTGGRLTAFTRVPRFGMGQINTGRDWELLINFRIVPR